MVVGQDADEPLEHRYESVYFDTPDLRCFPGHVEGREPRCKVRSRLYADRRRSAGGREG